MSDASDQGEEETDRMTQSIRFYVEELRQRRDEHLKLDELDMDVQLSGGDGEVLKRWAELDAVIEDGTRDEL